MLRVTQLVNGSMKYSNSIPSNSKTYVLKPVVLKLACIKSPGSLLKYRLLDPTPSCWSRRFSVTWQLEFLVSVQVMPSLLVLGPHYENHRYKSLMQICFLFKKMLQQSCRARVIKLVASKQNSQEMQSILNPRPALRHEHMVPSRGSWRESRQDDQALGRRGGIVGSEDGRRKMSKGKWDGSTNGKSQRREGSNWGRPGLPAGRTNRIRGAAGGPWAIR